MQAMFNNKLKKQLQRINRVLKQTAHKGFSLIELMIVIAIIGVLATVALPQYNNYIARAQVTEAINQLAGVKTVVAEFFASNGIFPTNVQLNGLLPFVATKYIATRDSAESNGAVGALSTFRVDITFQATNTSNLLASRTLSLNTNSFVNSTRWRCVSTQGTPVIANTSLPASCQNDAVTNPVLPTS